MPYFPYSRQSKKKSHRGAITARMVANLLNIAGVNHVITIDLHASQMQGFFKCPVDNLIAEPLLARWIRVNVPNWREAVVVSKNPGGTKRVTSLADALKLSFGIVTTDRRRTATAVHWNESAMFDQLRLDGSYDTPGIIDDALEADAQITPITALTNNPKTDMKPSLRNRAPSNPLRRVNGNMETLGSPLSKSVRVSSITEPEVPLETIRQSPEKCEDNSDGHDDEDESGTEEYTDEVRFSCVATPLCTFLNMLIITVTNLYSAPEMLFTVVSFKAILLMKIILRLPCLRYRHRHGATVHHPTAKTIKSQNT